MDLIRHGSRACVVEGTYAGKTLRCGFSPVQRKLAVDGSVCSRGQEYLSNSGVVVWMDHSDMNLLRGGGECRRRYLDFTGSQISGEYAEALRNYDRALRSRNYVLKRDAVVNWRQADAYAAVMAQCASVIWTVRSRLMTDVAGPASQAMGWLSGGAEEIQFQLQCGADFPDLREALNASRAVEERTRSTAAGPHRDDIAILINGREAGSFASEGQQRSISIAMKLAQAQVLERFRGQPPLLLLDDVFGELDQNRRRLLLENLPKGSQRLITTTGGEWVTGMGERLVYEVEGARLTSVVL